MLSQDAGREADALGVMFLERLRRSSFTANIPSALVNMLCASEILIHLEYRRSSTPKLSSAARVMSLLGLLMGYFDLT